MSETDASYTTKVGIEQKAEKIFVREDGIMKFFDVDFTGLFLRNNLLSRTMRGTTLGSAVLSNLNSRVTSVGAIVGALSNDIPGGTWDFVLDTGLSLFSMSMPIASEFSGVELIFRGAEVITDGNVILLAGSAGGDSVLGLQGSDLSSINLSADFYLKFVSNGAIWSVQDRNGSATEQASS